MNALVDPGSFRDPAGRVFASGQRIFRTIMPEVAADYESFRDAGVLDDLIRQDRLVGAVEVEEHPLGALAGGASYVLEHPRVPFISYPYEWSFPLHKRAALHHLDVQIQALDAGFSLADATAYNIQFVGTRPVFIDHLSFRRYRDGEIWRGHRQFCMQFLNPLLLRAYAGISANHWFRGSLEGIAPEEIAPLLPWRSKLSWTVLTHVVAQAALQRRSLRPGARSATSEPRLPRNALRGMLTGLRHFIGKLEPSDARTVWGGYASDNSYADAEAAEKRRFVSEMVAAVKPSMLFDIGCNSGDYSQAALDAGAQYVVGFDFDHGALDQAFRRFDEAQAPFLPLWFDAANPSPAQGWGQSERQGLAQRAKADALIALAFVHHIAIARNVPMDMVLDWLIAMAPQGVIEFPPKHDPMVQRLLAQREDIFPHYNEATFLTLLRNRARIVRSQHLAENGRLLVWYDRT